MKKYIILISIIILNFSCLKKNESATSSFIGKVNSKYVYYRLCYAQTVARFECYSDIDISQVDYNNIPAKCNTLTAFNASTTLTKEEYGDEIYNKIIEPIKTSNTLTVLTVDYDLFKKFDSNFRTLSRRNEVNLGARESYTYDCPESNAGIIVNLWKKIVSGSDIIYQQYSSPDLMSLQWSFIGGKSPSKMKYQEALKACSEYNTIYSNWSLASSEDLQKAIENGLGIAVNQALNQNVITPNDFIWTKTPTFIKQAIVPWKKTPNDKNIDKNDLDTQTHYAVCSRSVN